MRDNYLKNFPSELRDGILKELDVSLVDFMGWLQLRIVLPQFCVFADTDYEMTPAILSDLNDVVGNLLHEPETVVVDFDNESADTARIIMSSESGGMTRLTIIDWCDVEGPPRLDIKLPTATIIRCFQDAVSGYAATTDLELNDLIPVYDWPL